MSIELREPQSHQPTYLLVHGGAYIFWRWHRARLRQSTIEEPSEKMTCLWLALSDGRQILLPATGFHRRFASRDGDESLRMVHRSEPVWEMVVDHTSSSYTANSPWPRTSIRQWSTPSTLSNEHGVQSTCSTSAALAVHTNTRKQTGSSSHAYSITSFDFTHQPRPAGFERRIIFPQLTFRGIYDITHTAQVKWQQADTNRG